MSITSSGLTKCESCGHWVTKGRLTCQNCGAVADIKQAISNIDFYKSIERYEAEEYRKILENLNDWALDCDSIMISNIVVEIHQADFRKFRDIVAINLKHGATYHEKLNPNIRLFKTYISVGDDSFTRFVAIEGENMYICEVSEYATIYLDDIIYEIDLKRRIEQAPGEIWKLNKSIERYEYLVALDKRRVNELQEKLEGLIEKKENRKKSREPKRFFIGRVSTEELNDLRSQIEEATAEMNRTIGTLDSFKRQLEEQEKLLDKKGDGNK